jgi:hypothetical protein
VGYEYNASNDFLETFNDAVHFIDGIVWIRRIVGSTMNKADTDHAFGT